jgi:hypothetical protein
MEEGGAAMRMQGKVCVVTGGARPWSAARLEGRI